MMKREEMRRRFGELCVSVLALALLIPFASKLKCSFPINQGQSNPLLLSPFALECLHASFGAFFCGRGCEDEKKKKKKSAKIKDILGLAQGPKAHVQASDEARAPFFFLLLISPT